MDDSANNRTWLTRSMWSAYLAYHMWGQPGFPFKPLEVIKRVQAKRVQRAVKHAYHTVPYYHETMNRLGLMPANINSAEDLQKLPLLEREQVQRDPEYFVSTATPLNRCLKLRSGGSTGAPLTIYHDTAALFQNAAHGERERCIVTGLVGQSFGYRETVIVSHLGTAHSVQRYCSNHGLFPREFRIQRQYISVLDPPEKVIRLLKDFKPTVIKSHGSHLGILAAHLQATGESFQWPRVVAYGADSLPDFFRRAAEEKFKTQVFSIYGAVEALKIGFECAHHAGLHVNIDLYPVRVVNSDGGSLPLGDSGDIIVSNLVNRATVLLNYRLGDIASLLPEPCPCGRSLPLLSPILGRCDDWIRLPSGQSIHPQSVRVIFTNEEQILLYQVIQETPTCFRVFIVAGNGCNRQATRERIANKFVETFGEGIATEIVFVDSIDRTVTGKFRPIISKCTQSPLNEGTTTQARGNSD